MATHDPKPTTLGALEPIPSITVQGNEATAPETQAALQKLTTGHADGSDTQSANGTSSSDLEASQEKQEEPPQEPQRGPMKIFLIMSSLCVSTLLPSMVVTIWGSTG